MVHQPWPEASPLQLPTKHSPHCLSPMPRSVHPLPPLKLPCLLFRPTFRWSKFLSRKPPLMLIHESPGWNGPLKMVLLQFPPHVLMHHLLLGYLHQVSLPLRTTRRKVPRPLLPMHPSPIRSSPTHFRLVIPLPRRPSLSLSLLSLNLVAEASAPLCTAVIAIITQNRGTAPLPGLAP